MNYNQQFGKNPDDLNNGANSPRVSNHKSYSHINPEMSLESIKEKIGFSWLSLLGSVFFGVALCILNRAGDIYLVL